MVFTKVIFTKPSFSIYNLRYMTMGLFSEMYMYNDLCIKSLQYIVYYVQIGGNCIAINSCFPAVSCTLNEEKRAVCILVFKSSNHNGIEPGQDEFVIA